MVKERRIAAPQRVVGVGASAGGLEALKLLVASIPADTGLAFVVLQHLPPSQTGQLANLLATSTGLPVLDAKSGHRIAPNTIVVVPPRTSACLFRGALVLRTTKGGGRPHLPIDGLFVSLADVLGARAIGVVLSGSASDGTAGLRAIQAAGGITFAQEPSTAQFDDMPRSAITAGVAEIVLPPAQIGGELGAIATLGPRAPARPKSGIERVLEQLREASGIDFTSYKRTTIERRLARRLAKLELASLDDYSAYLDVHEAEGKLVYEDLLVHVTEFFRDRRVFERLATLVFPDLVRDKPANAPFRVWVPGCSTGEEVYSIAIALVELVGDSRQLQLFGSDLSERAIETARRGHYPASIDEQVGAERLQRFFRRDGTGFRINRDIRERCVFVRHDLASDPPFSKLDLVSCRNLLIYMGPILQNRVIPILHYALNQPGYLVLGPAETIAGFESMFSTIDGDARIYARKPVARAALTFPTAGRLDRLPWRRAADTARSALDVQRDVDHVLLARYAPACVLVDDNLDIVQFRGHTGPYLESPPGQPQLNLVRMARDGLSSELPLAIERARRTDAPVRQHNVVVREGGRDHVFHLEVVPLPGATEARGYFLIVFEDVSPVPLPTTKRRPGKTPRLREQSELLRVRQELAATKEYLHSVATQHMATSEELGITNEELQSSNEELQSSNEELQTAKEELQSTNEELETVNEELQRGNELLREANDDLVNVLSSVQIAIIIVDTERRVRRYTPTARDVMRLIPGDVGRPIGDLRTNVGNPGLDAAIAEVIETLAVSESEVRHANGTVYRMQIRPYRTEDHVISGAVIAFVDITALHAARDRATAIVETVPTPLVVVDDRLHVLSANTAFMSAFTASDRDVAGRALFDIGVWRAPGLRARLEAVLASGVGAADLEADHHGDAGVRNLKLAANPIPAPDGHQSLLIGIADVTEHRRLEEAREAAKRERDAFLDAVSHELRTPLSAIVLWAQALRELEPDDPRRAQAIDTILSSAKAEADLVDDLLELSTSRPSTAKLDATIPSSIVREVIDNSRGAAEDKQIALTVEIGAELDSIITTDSRQLRQITSELVGNAIKFTPAGGKIWVDLGLENGAMKLRVRDTGPGISPEFVGRAFEPFAQADASTTRAHRGLGIGLARVRRFVESQGGVVDVESPGHGQGTTFTVRLPTRA